MRKLHAIIPAAGHSRRMGQPKLLMAFGGEPLLTRLIRQLTCREISSINVLVRADDALLRTVVQESNANAVVAACDPQEMLDSVRLLLHHLQEHHQMNDNDGWLLIPGDHPFVLPNVLQQLVVTWSKANQQIVVPTHLGKRGHPTIFPWTLSHQLDLIPAGWGLNWLVRESSHVCEVAVDTETIHWDLDTPADVDAARAWLEAKERKHGKNAEI